MLGFQSFDPFYLSSVMIFNLCRQALSIVYSHSLCRDIAGIIQSSSGLEGLERALRRTRRLVGSEGLSDVLFFSWSVKRSSSAQDCLSGVSIISFIVLVVHSLEHESRLPGSPIMVFGRSP